MTPATRLNAEALSFEDAAKLLCAVGKFTATPAMLRADVAAGAPTNPDGTLHIIHYIAWLLREMLGG